METERILAVLRQHASELQQAGLLHVRLFGSMARGEACPDSDIDLLAEFDPQRSMSLVSVGVVQQRLNDLLNRTVDLSSAEWLREPMRDAILREAVLAF